MKYIKTLLYLLLGLQTLIFAQQMRTDKIPKIGVLYGTVIDSSSRKPIQYASVSVVSMRTNEIVTGGITGENGTFRITEIPLGQYDVVVEFIGYKREIIKSVMLTPRGDGIEQNLGKVELQLTTLQMEAVEVQGERPIYVQTAEKKIFNVEQNTVSSGGTLLDALRQVPGVDVDIDGKVSLRGNTNVNILIDGKPSIITSSDQEMMLEAIPADNIQDIEVITNPSAKYDPEGMAGIINIILKENKFAGLNGNIKAGASTNDAYNTSGQINFRNEKVNLFLNSALRNDIRSGSGGNYRETYTNDSTTTILDQNISGERGGKSYLIKSGLELYPNLNNTIGLTLSYSNGDRIGDRTVETEETIIDSIIHYYRDTDADNDHTSLDVTLTYNRKFNKPKQKLSAFANHSTGIDNRTHSMISTANPEWLGFDADPERTTTDNEKNESNLQMDYIHPFSRDFKLEMGYKGTYRSFNNKFFTYDISQDGMNTETIDSSRSNHFLFDENIHAAYTQFSFQKGIADIQMGLRGETVATVSELVDADSTVENPYTSFFPSATLTFGPQVFQMQLSYSRRIQRPSYRQLNPAIHQLDQNSIRTGNPFLKPEYIDVAEVGLSRFNNGFTTSLTAYYRRITDLISHHKTINDEGVTIVSYENYDELQNYGLEFILSGSLGKGLRIMVNGNLFSDEVDASSAFDNDNYDETSTGFFGRVSTIWNIAPSTELMLTGFYRSPRDIPIGSLKAMSFSSLSVKKKFLDDRLAVSLRLNDLFDTMGFGFTTENDHYYQESYRKFDSQIATITLEYHFGKMEDRSRYGRKRNGQGNDSEIGGFEIE